MTDEELGDELFMEWDKFHDNTNPWPKVVARARALITSELAASKAELPWTSKPQYEPKTLRQEQGYLIEEFGEVLAAVGKALRWGLESYNPELPVHQRETNRQWILRELDDAERACQRLRAALARKG